VRGALIGSELGGRYRIVRRIGAGGMGTVYEAIVRNTGARVAIKTLHAGEGGHQKAARFRREARAIAAIEHPAVLRTFDVGTTEDGSPYLVMELLSGRTLASLVERVGKLPIPIALAIVEQILEGLVAAHVAGVVHRDLKPENVFLHVGATSTGPRTTVKIVDFGIAKLVEGLETARLTATGTVLGTPEYMSPEQAAGGAVDARADVYATGLLTYEMLCGRRPYADLPPQRIFAAILAGAAPALSERDPTLPPEIVAWVGRAMARDPAARFPSAPAALSALRATLADQQLVAAVAEARTHLTDLVDAEPMSRVQPDALGNVTPRLEAHPSVHMQRRTMVTAFVTGVVVATVMDGLTLGPSLRHLPFSLLGTGAGVMLGSILLGLAWSAVALGAPIARVSESAGAVVALGASQAIHHFYLALLAIAPGLGGNPWLRSVGLGAAALAVPATFAVTRGQLGARAHPLEGWAYAAAIAVGAVASRAGSALLGVAAITLVVSLGSAVALIRAARDITDVDRARRVRSTALGLALHGALLSAKLLPMLGATLQVFSLVGLFPIGLVAYGVLGIDTVAREVRRTTQAIALFSRFATMLLGVYVATFLVLAAQHFSKRTDLLALTPPLFTAAVALLLAWRIFAVEAPTLRTWLTGLALGAMGVLKLTWAYGAMAPTGDRFADDAGIVWFSRAANTWFVFYPPLVVHLCRLVTKREGDRWVLFTAYGLPLLVAPITLSEGFFPKAQTFWFGTIVLGGWGYAFFYSVAGGCFSYVLVLVLGSLRHVEGPDRATRQLVAVGLIGTSALLIMDGVPVAGGNVYPFGNFAFVPLVVLAYGLLRGEIPELSTFVRRGLLHTALSALLAVCAGALLVSVLRYTRSSNALVGATAAALVVLVTIEPLRRLGQAGIDRILGTQFDDHGAIERLGRLAGTVEGPRALADEAARLLAEVTRATRVVALLDDGEGRLVGGALQLLPDDPALREIRRTSAPLRCGPDVAFSVPGPLASVGREVCLVPLGTSTGFLGALVVAPSRSEPLVVPAARRFLHAYADLAALLVDRATVHERVDEEVERRTRALAEVVAELERTSGERAPTITEDVPRPGPAVTLEEGTG